MSITATVENDTIKLPNGVHLPDGTTVKIETVEAPQKSFAERFAKYIGASKTGAPDMAAEHDHYLYGTPKKK